MVDYTDTIEVHGLRVPFVPEIITPKIEKPLRRGRYGKGEVDLLLSVLKPGDRLLDLGGGLGIVSAAVAQTLRDIDVLTIEADRRLTRLIRKVWHLNNVTTPNLIQAAVVNKDAAATAPVAPFYIRPNFWSSSAAPDDRPHDAVAEVPSVSLGDLLADHHPTVLFCDIEGGELDLWQGADLSGLRQIVLKLHPEVYGQDGMRVIVDRLAELGFLPNHAITPDGALRLFDRIPTGAETGAERDIEDIMPRRRYRAERSESSAPLRILLPTCMKNEGPFILEWLAWHRAIGVTDFVVYTNGCTDGTDRLLDHLARRGLLRHMPNPALAVTATNFQPVALQYTHFLPEFEAADYVLSMDVDEFVNVRVGDGTLAALIKAAGDFDVLSISELNHGCNGQNRYQEGHVTALFPAHQTETPGNKRAQRGVKSLVRMSPRVSRIRNHRPDMYPNLGTVLWRDGSAQLRQELMQEPGDNGWDCRGTYDLVSLDHFPLRSLESFLVKMHRGDVVVANKKASNRYWRTRNFSEATNSNLTRMRDRMQDEYDALLAVPETRRLHDACVAAHRARIAALSDEPEYLERKAWIYNEAWRDDFPEEAAGFLRETPQSPQDD